MSKKEFSGDDWDDNAPRNAPDHQYWDCDDCGERYPLLRRHGYPPCELETITDEKHVCGPGHDEVLWLCPPCYNKRAVNI
jgi:hypothetical protein